MTSSRKSLGSSILFYFLIIMELIVLVETFNTLEIDFITFPRSIPPHNSISELYGQFLGIHGEVSALTCTVNCGTLYKKVCFFLSHVHWIELTTGGLHSSYRDISRMIKGNWMHLSSIWIVIAKGKIIDIRYFSFSFLINLLKFLKTCFHFVILGYFV